MEKTVYIDLLFLVNFSMDFLCFYITSKIISIKASPIRVIIASSFGGIYSCLALFAPNIGKWSILVDIAVCFLMCLLVYARGQGSDIFLCTVLYVAVSMSLGGFMTAIFNLLNKLGFAKEAEGVREESISFWLFLLIALISAFFTLLGGRFFRKRSSVHTVLVEIIYMGKRGKFCAIVDSGNFLCEPISGRPCVVADVSALTSFVPEEILDLCRSKSVSMLETISAEYGRSIRLIPTKSATGEGLLLSIKPESLKIDSGRGFYEADAMLAITELDEREKALVPSQLIK